MNKYLLMGAGLAVAYMAGRYSAPEKIKIEKEFVEKVVQQKAENEDQDKRKLIVETVKPDGTKTTKTLIRTKTQIQKVSSVESNVASRESTSIENRRGTRLSILAGVPLSGPLYLPVYGASASKPVLGPFSLGVWAFTDLRVGFSIGMEF